MTGPNSPVAPQPSMACGRPMDLFAARRLIAPVIPFIIVLESTSQHNRLHLLPEQIEATPEPPLK
jgi:hypothetical protein